MVRSAHGVGLGFLVAIAIVFSQERPARADAYCGGGKHVGAENDGQGMSWICTPDAPRPALPDIPSGNNLGAGLQGAAAGLEGLGALLDIANLLGSRITAPDVNGPVHDVDSEKADILARDFNRQAIAAMQAGRFDQAAILFNKAAGTAWDSDLRDANSRDAEIADAENSLKQGYLAEQRGNLAAASRFYMQGKQAAAAAGQGDLAVKLAAYNDGVVARAGGAKNGVSATNAPCMNVNGQTLCQ